MTPFPHTEKHVSKTPALQWLDNCEQKLGGRMLSGEWHSRHSCESTNPEMG